MNPSASVARPRSLDELGFEPRERELIRRLLRPAHGLVAVIGPRKSGRTTTLRALASEIGAHRGQVRCLESFEPRAFQDHCGNADALVLDLPDGAADPALIARLFSAVAQGQFILTTLSGERAHHVIPLLRALGRSREELAFGLTLILAQALVQTLCRRCTEEDSSEETRGALAQAANTWLEASECSPRAQHAGGCLYCNGAGVAGRALLGECIEIDSSARALIEEGVPSGVMEQALLGEGRSMWDQGLRLLARGEISLGALRESVREPR